MRAFFLSVFLLMILAQVNGQSEISDKDLNAILQISDDTLRMDSLYNVAAATVDINPKQSIRLGKLLLQDAESHGYRPGVANANRVLGDAYEYLPDYPLSLKYYIDALTIQKELKQYPRQISSLLNMAVICDLTGDLANQKKYAGEAMVICDGNKGNDKVQKKRPRIVDFLATVYKKEGKYDTAIKLYKEAIALAKKDGNKDQQMNSLANMAIAFKSMKNYEASLAAYNEASALLDTAREKYTFAILEDNMAILFYNMGDYAKSEQHAFHALALAGQSNNNEVLRDIYENLKNTFVKEKKYPQALDYFEKFSAAKDSIFDHDRQKQIKELQAKYDTETKDKQIAMQNAEISINRKITLFLIVITVLLMVIGVLAILNQRKKKHLNEQITLQMQRELEVKDRDNEIYRLRNVELKNSNEEIVLRNKMIEEEKRRSEKLLRNILPEETANELMQKGFASSHKYELVTVMFIDIVGFTVIAENLKAEDLVERLDYYFQAFDHIVVKHGLEKIKTIGDSYMCAGGLPVANTSNPSDTVNAALDIMNFVAGSESKHFFNIRIGIHSGSLVAGVVGRHKFQYDIWGDTVNVAARIEENSEPGRINISGSTYELVRNGFVCEYRGKIRAKNKGELDMYFVNGEKE